MPSSSRLFPFTDPTIPNIQFGGQEGSSFESVADKMFNDFHRSVSDAVIYSVALSVLSTGAILVIAYLVYRCLKEHGLPSINIKTTGVHGGAELTPLLPDSTIQDATIENFLNEITREKHIRFTSQQLNGYTQHMSAELGEGGFGAVYKGMLPNGLDIAVKVLHRNPKTGNHEVTEQQFMAEVGTLWRTNHANLIRLIGYCYDGGMRALVYEYMPNSSLDKFLFDRKRMAGSSLLLAIAVGVARGLRYLHEECQKKIIHYDVKAGNVLLDDSLTPKLTDFGMAQLLSRADAHATVQARCGTVGYMAREVVDVETAAITEKCDVYSFGMLLFEVISRRKIIDNSLPESERWLPLLAWTMYQEGKLLDLMKKCHNSMAAADEEQWKETAERMCKVAFLCVQDPPNARPTMSMVVNMLEGHLEIPPSEYPLG
ncbi:unnamed protein product [Urochloa decumbens]|uniref:non-specific serine/threonine protein kinase n=1 Tax=Urochloa decumbens TaxID=240449 RepID=A0ABC9H116_9POAL